MLHNIFKVLVVVCLLLFLFALCAHWGAFKWEGVAFVSDVGWGQVLQGCEGEERGGDTQGASKHVIITPFV